MPLRIGRVSARAALLVLVIFLVPYLAAQSSPACTQRGSLTTATHYTALPNNTGNPNCNSWALTWSTQGFSAVTIQFEGSDNNTSWAAFSGSSTVVVGTNPSSTLSGTIVVQASSTNAYVRVNVTSVTGTGAVNFQLYGYNGVTPTAKKTSGGTVTTVTATAPITSSGGATPNISATYQGNGPKIQLASSGTPTPGNCTQFDSANNVSDAGAPCSVQGPAGPAGPTGPAGPAGPQGIPGVPGYSPNTLLSGGQVIWTSGLNFTVSPTSYQIAGTQYTAPQTNLTLSAADPSNPRIDAVVVNTSSVVAVLTGTPAATPQEPTVDPSLQLLLTFVLVPAGSSTPANVTNSLVYDEDVGPPSEWTWSSSGAGFNLASTNNPYSGTKDIEATAVTTGNYVEGAVSPSITASIYNYLVFYVRSKASWGKKQLQIQFQNAGTLVGSAVVLNDGAFGFSSSQITSYQQIAVPITLFGINGDSVNQVKVTVAGSGSSIGFYLDLISVQGGLPGPSAPTSMTWLGAWSATTAYAVNDVVTNGGSTWVALLANTNSMPALANANWAQVSASGVTSLTGDGALINNSASTGSVTLTLANAAAHKFFGNNTGSSGASGYNSIGASDLIGSYAAGGGTAQAQTVTLSPAATSLTVGLTVKWLPSNANSGAGPTLAVNGLTATTITKCGVTSLVANDLTTSAVATATYDGSGFQLLNPQAATCGATSQMHSITIPIAGSPIATGTGNVGVPSSTDFSCTINKAMISANASGSITVDVWKANASIPNSGNKISGTSPVTLSSAQLNQNSSLSGWTTSVSSDDVFWASVATADGVLTSVALQLWCQ